MSGPDRFLVCVPGEPDRPFPSREYAEAYATAFGRIQVCELFERRGHHWVRAPLPSPIVPDEVSMPPQTHDDLYAACVEDVHAGLPPARFGMAAPAGQDQMARLATVDLRAVVPAAVKMALDVVVAFAGSIDTLAQRERDLIRRAVTQEAVEFVGRIVHPEAHPAP